MMTDEEKEIFQGLATSPDFLAALQEALDNLSDKADVAIHEVGFWFFTQGYMSCQNFIEQQKKFRSFKYEAKNEI